jgi:DNA-binding MarR family transcriptional regulator
MTPRWQILGALRNHPHTVAGIARDMCLTRQSVQRTADLLAAEDLVEYTDNPAHRRSKLVRLSPFGQEILARISGRQIAWTNELAEAMPVAEKELRAALEVLRHLRVELERPHRGQLPGQREATPSS